MSGEFIVPTFISLGLMTIMLRTLAFPEFRLQRAHVQGTHCLSSANQSQPCMALTNSQPWCVEAKPQDEGFQFVEGLRRSLSRYQDCRVALADNYLSRASDETQSIWEFTNYWYGFKAAFDFDPEHPTSLIYQRDSFGEYHLIGAAFTASERFSIEQRRERIPGGIAEWQPHGMFGWVARIYFHPEAVEEKGSAA